jgi:pimeloyl-ACP methyl ester carboxylesterase
MSSDFAQRTLDVNGVKTVVQTLGSGPPLVFFHGAGTVTGFDFAPEWARRFSVVLPYHPGFGQSDDDSDMTEIGDYVAHYVELFAMLGLKSVNLVGQSLGGFIAAQLAAEHGNLVRKLALVCPIGIPIPEHPSVDFLKVPPQELPALLAADPQTVIRHLPANPDEAFFAERGKEATAAGRILSEGLFDPALVDKLPRITAPTMLVWGKEDRLTPVAQHKRWSRLLPQADVRLYDGAGHLVLDEAPESVAAISDFFAT